MKKQTNNEFNKNNIEGITPYAISSDNSGDMHVFGQTSWNRNEFILDFTGGETTDVTGHYTPVYTRC